MSMSRLRARLYATGVCVLAFGFSVACKGGSSEEATPVPVEPTTELSTQAVQAVPATDVLPEPEVGPRPEDSSILGDPAGHILDGVDNNGTPIISSEIMTVTLWAVVGLRPDSGGSPESDGCRTMASRNGGIGDNWNMEPHADPGLFDPGADPFAMLVPQDPTHINPPTNPLVADPNTGAYGWLAGKRCYFVAVTRGTVTH
jgi:hypothetical protein